MSIAGNVKSLLQIKVKPRYDSYSDQFHRVAMVKVLMASSMLLGLNWFKDTITCIVPGTAEMDRGYVQQACWIQGRFDLVYCALKWFMVLWFLKIYGCYAYYLIRVLLTMTKISTSVTLLF